MVHSSFLTIAVLVAGVAAQAYPYRVTDLGTLGGTSSVARGMSPDGTKIVGWCTDRAFLWEQGRGMRELLPLAGYTRAYAYDVNDAGFVVGQAGLEVTGPEPARALRWDPAGSPTNLGTIGGGRFSMAFRINASGQVVGTTEVLPTTTRWHAFLWNAGTGMIDLTPNSSSAFGGDLNDRGQVTGYWVLGGNHAFRHDPVTGALDLGVPATFAHSFGSGINVAGQVCGHVTTASGNSERAARYTDGIGWEILGGVGQTNPGFAINDFGQVVGTGRPTAGLERAWLHTDGLGMQDLTLLVDPAARWRLMGAHDINDRGQITGYGFNGVIAETHAFRLDPEFVTIGGAGCTGGNGRVPKLGVAGLPAAGERISVLLADGRPQGLVVLAVSTNPGALLLPGGCTLWVGLDAVGVWLGLDGIGRAVLPIDVPPGVMPATLHLQYVSFDDLAPNGVFALSNAVQLRVL